MISKINLSIVLFFAFFLMGCGRYLPPLPPETFAPKGVEQLEVTADQSGVILKWRSPSVDQKGKELKSLDGYQVVRNIMPDSEEKEAEEKSEDLEPEILTFIEDLSVTEREKERDVARSKGLVARRVKANPELQAFTYLDTTVEPGVEYLYQIIPINQGGVKGAAPVGVRVLFRGASSEIAKTRNDKLEDIEPEEF